MPQLTKAQFNEVVQEVVRTAPDGLSQDQLRDLVFARAEEVERQSYETNDTVSPASSLLQRGQNAIIGGVMGAIKGAASSAVGAGELIQNIPGVSAGVDRLYGTPGLSAQAMPAAREALQPINTAERVGFGSEQIAEVITPGGLIRRGAVAATRYAAPIVARVLGGGRRVAQVAQVAPRAAVEGAAVGGVSAVQGGDPRVGVVGGAAGPVIGAATRSAAPWLRTAATKQVEQALGATGQRFKTMAERLVPGILRRGLGGSREQLQARAAGMAEEASNKIDDALQQYGSRVSGTRPIHDALEQAKEAFRGANMAGEVVVIDPRAIAQLNKVQQVIAEYGDNMTVNMLVKVRRAWDTIVSNAGGYAHRGQGAIGQPLKDQSAVSAMREGASAIRKLLDKVTPELSAVNKEFSFWKGLDEVLSQTLQRTQPQSSGVLGQMAAGAGTVTGAVVMSPTGPVGTAAGALAFGKLAKMAQQVFTSSRWRFATAKMKDQLADAIMSGDQGRIAMALGRVASVQGSKVGLSRSRRED